jgi:hypothetical protein
MNPNDYYFEVFVHLIEIFFVAGIAFTVYYTKKVKKKK